MTDKKLKSAIAGCGGIANVHASVLNGMENTTLISCCDEKYGVSRQFGEKHGCVPYKSLRDLFAAEKPDVLHICTPHYTHVPLALYAINSGVNVLLEKPVAITPIELTLLQNALISSKSQLAVCFQNRYNPSVVAAKKLITSGESGAVLGARAIVTWRRDDGYYLKSDWRGSKNTEGAGVLINQAIHTVDLLYYFLGKPEKISGTTANRKFVNKTGVEDTAEATFFYPNGTTALFYATLDYSTDEAVLLDIHCENMKLRIENDSLTIFRPDGSVSTPNLEKRTALGKNYWGSSHSPLIADFYNAVSTNAKFPLDAFEGGHAFSMICDILQL